MYYLGVDLGTSSVKVLLVDEQGAVQKAVSRTYPLEFPQPGWSQQSPADWWTATPACIPELLQGVGASQVKGLGVGGTRTLLIGGSAKPAAVRALAPAILGMDVELPETDEYVAIGAARQAAWVLSGEAEPPAWPVKVETTLTGEPTPQVYEQYVRWRG